MCMFKIALINGYPESGKDTFVKYVNDTKVHVFNCHTSTPAKRAFKEAGWDGSKTPAVRDALSACMELFEDLFEASTKFIDANIKECLEEQKKIGYDNNFVLFVHVREPKNIKKYLEKYEYYHIHSLLINRTTDLKHIKNHSDTQVKDIKYDITIDNNGTLQELKEKAEAYAEVYLCR